MNDFKTELKTAKNLKEFLDICQKHYDCENAKLGDISRGLLIANIDKVIMISGAKKRDLKKAQTNIFKNL